MSKPLAWSCAASCKEWCGDKNRCPAILSETPRVDTVVINTHLPDRGQRLALVYSDLLDLSRQLERELAGADGRIRELEEDYDNISSQLATANIAPSTAAVGSAKYPGQEIYPAMNAAHGSGQLAEWVRERLDNCHRLAAMKSGDDRAGWLEDASYFSAILEVLTRVPSSKAVVSGVVFLCRASGEGSHDFRVCNDREAVMAFYEEMTGRDQDGTLTSLTSAFDDQDEWSNDGTALEIELYCAKFEVWKADAAQLIVASSATERPSELDAVIKAAEELVSYVKPNRMKHITEVKLTEAIDAWHRSASTGAK